MVDSLYISKSLPTYLWYSEPLHASDHTKRKRGSWKFEEPSILHYFLYIHRHVTGTVAENGGWERRKSCGMRKNKNVRIEWRINNVYFQQYARVGIHNL
jgi:hypothetical protein